MIPLDDPLYYSYGSREEATKAAGDQCKMMSDVLGVADSVLAATGADSLALATREIQTGLAMVKVSRMPVPGVARGLLFFGGALLISKGVKDGAMLAADQASTTLGGPHVPNLTEIFFPDKKNTDKVDKAEKAAAEFVRNRMMDSMAKRAGTFARGGWLPSRGTVGAARELLHKCQLAADATLAKQKAGSTSKERASLTFD